MKKFKRIMALVIALAMVLGMSAMTALAETQTVTVGTEGGSITITNTTVGKSYAIYKLFDATVTADGSGISYTLPSGKTIASPADDWFEVKTVGSVSTVIAKAALTEAVLKSDDFKTWAEGFGTQVGSTTAATADSVKFDKIPYGYYYVTSTLGTAITVDSTTPDAEIVDKNQIPSWDNGNNNPGKVIIEDGQKVSLNEASLNEDVTFDIGVNATNYDKDKKIWKYVITDEIDPGMTYDISATHPLVVKVGDTEIAQYNGSTNKNGYSITYYKADGTTTTTVSEAQSFRIELNWTDGGTLAADHLYANAVEIHVQYHGFLDPSKGNDNIYDGTTTNKNKANFTWYEDDDTPDDNGKDPDHEQPEKQTDTYTTELTILKTDGTNALTGAEFTLTSSNGATVVITITDSFVADNTEAATHWLLKDGTYTTTDPTTTGINQDLYQSTTQKYKKTTSTAVTKGANQTETTIKAKVADDGTVTFKGLGVGNYTISESIVPTGYNKADDITFGLTFDATNKKFVSDNEDVVVGDDNKLDTTIVNNKGTELPSTGGIGTTIFYVVGAILVIGAGVIMITRRRMDA